VNAPARKPRLCMVLHGPYPLGEVRVSREVRAAVAAGFAVDVVATRQPGEPRSELVEGARVIRLPVAHRYGGGILRVVGEYASFTVLALARVALLSARERYDVVQIHNPPDFLMVAALVPKLLGAKVILDVHDLAPDMFWMRFGERRGADAAERVLRLVEARAAAFADAVITVHQPYRRELIARGVPANKVTIVMNSLDENVLPPRVEQAPASDGFRVVYHGTVTPTYGVELLVEAVAQATSAVPDMRLEIIGEGDALHGTTRRAKELGIGERVAITPRFLPQTEVLARVQNASVGVIPNLPSRLNRYALSTKLFEYVALGIPVVSAGLPTIREHFSEDEILYFTPGDADSLARALTSIAENPDDARARADAARRRYEEYRWPTNAARYSRVLNGASATGETPVEDADARV
jgi:glycosyltransferase involved in cell wall biosynthesis